MPAVGHNASLRTTRANDKHPQSGEFNVMQRQRVSTGTPWESQYGYSRAIRSGPFIFVSGTTATDAQGSVIACGDPYEQTVYILDKIRTALDECGATLSDVVCTRAYLVNVDDWPAVARAHARSFADVRPAATLVEVRRLVDPRLLVEMEVQAVVGGASC
jgi:enamine deaminase RidA (YjgF/YER057c/UK114 family)